MASPFYLFRKYQKAFLVVAGVLAMFIFVVADPLMSWLQSNNGGGGQRNAKTVVASWDGGSLNLQQLDRLSRRRFKIGEFLGTLVDVAARTIEQEGGTAQAPNLPDFRLRDNNPRSVQEGCVTTRVLAELSKQSGITVSDEVINHYLREWGLGRMGDAEIISILNRVGLDDKTLFAGLRELLMGNFYLSSYAMATRGVLPEERWQDWKRINERIAVEAALLPADKFLAEVPEPSGTELQAFYELHKDRIDGGAHLVMGVRLPSPNPGFREPRRVKLQYLLGSIDDWTQKMSNTITEAEIADYYEQNKRTQFVKTSTSTSADGLFDEDEKSAVDAGEAKSSDADSKGAEPAAESEDSSEPAAETPAEEESSLLPRKSPFRLAAFQEDGEAGEGETASEEASDSETEKSEEGTETTEAEDEEPLEFEPLENVREQIRRELAKDKAAVEMQNELIKIYASLQSTYNLYGSQVVAPRAEESEIPSPPASLADYSELAEKSGLLLETTVLLSDQGVFDTSVGKAVDAQSGRERVVKRLFDDLELFEPLLAKDFVQPRFEEFAGRDRNWYLVCKTEDVASRVPEFDEVRDAVRTAWKKHEAAQLALAKAKELAQKAEESGDTVAAVARGLGYEIVTTDMFSWLSFGTTPQEMQRGPRLGEAPPLKAVGVDLMTQAFKLQPDQKIALLNYDQSSAYVLQLDRREQTEAEMRRQFLAEANTWYGGRVMSSARWGNAQRQLLGQLSADVGLNLDKLEEFLSSDSQ